MARDARRSQPAIRTRARTAPPRHISPTQWRPSRDPARPLQPLHNGVWPREIAISGSNPQNSQRTARAPPTRCPGAAARHPRRIGSTPLVPLRRDRAPGCPCRCSRKCEHLNPGGSVKDRIALAIVDDAERRGVLAPRRHAHRSHRRQHRRRPGAGRRRARLPARLRDAGEDVRRQARRARALGARVVIHANAPPGRPAQLPERRRAASPRSMAGSSTDQFAQPGERRASTRRTTGPEILEQAGGRDRRVRRRRRHRRHHHRRRARTSQPRVPHLAS